jgi:cobalamin biosynthetic protein CobC
MLMEMETASTLPSLRAAQDVSHGGRLNEARALFPHAPEPFIDLSTGINPIAYPVPELPLGAWHRLPEPEAIAALEAQAARAYEVANPEAVVAIPGTQILISLLPYIFPARSVAILGPTYSEYADAWTAGGARVQGVDRLESLIDADIAIICNPNNPDGRRLGVETILDLLGKRGGRGLLMVDEAFADLEDPSLSVAPCLPQDGLLVLRSLSKGYGLGGLRLGFALAASATTSRIRKVLGPWQVSGPAIAIGAAALGDKDWRERARARAQNDVARLDLLLQAACLTVLGGTRLFRLAQSETAPALFTRLGEAGLFVRRFDRRPDWLRFGVPNDEEAWSRLAAALEG